MAKFNCNFISYVLKRAVDLTVIIPSLTYLDAIGKGAFKMGEETHMQKEKYPVVYLLHGIGNDHAAFSSYTNVQLYAEERRIAVVMMSAENKHYADQTKEDDFYQFVEKELPDFICAMFPVSGRKEDTYIAGLSMGGYGTLIHALPNTERYAAAGAFSAALHINPVHGENALNRLPQHDLFALAERMVEDGRQIPLYLSCGEEDFLFGLNLKFKEHLKTLGIPFTWEQEPGYGHEWRFWDRQVEKFLDWIPRTDCYAQERRKC